MDWDDDCKPGDDEPKKWYSPTEGEDEDDDTGREVSDQTWLVDRQNARNHEIKIRQLEKDHEAKMDRQYREGKSAQWCYECIWWTVTTIAVASTLIAGLLVQNWEKFK